jgi:hypothetical protein
LLVGEGPHLQAVDRNRSDWLVVLKHRYNEQCPDTAKFNGRNCQWIAVEVGWVYTIVGNMDCLTGLDDTADRG